jgi:hypothetical protein
LGTYLFVATLRDHLEEVLLSVDAEQRERLAALVERLTTEQDARARVSVVFELIDLLGAELPVDHPVRRAMAREDVRYGSAPADLEPVLLDLRQAVREYWPGGPDPDEMLRQAKERLLGAAMYSAGDVRAQGQDPGAAGLIRLRRDGDVLLPAFQFDRAGVPLPVVVEVNRILRADTDPWGVADWWLGRDPWLGAVPSALIGQVPDATLVSAARAVRGED